MRYLFFFSAFTLSLQLPAQSTLSLSTEATSHPGDFLFFEGSIFDEFIDFWPMLEGRLSFNQVVSRAKKWRWQAGLSYRYAQLNYGQYKALTFPDEIDPFYGFVRETGDPALSQGKIFETFQWLGLQAGIAHRFNRKKGWKNFWLGAGAFVQLPVANYLHFADTRSNQTNNSSIDFYNYYSFYGFYLQPSYNFNLAKNGRGKWSLEVFARANALLRSQHGGNPFFSAGGGVGINYQLMK